MKIKYECEYCGEQFESLYRCRVHEASHFTGVKKIKYELINSHEEYICDYCKHSYYVYGCERDCKFNDCTFCNNFKHFEPVEPLHNKKKNGGI